MKWILVLLCLVCFLSSASAGSSRELSCSELQQYVAQYGIELVVRIAKARGVSDETIKRMRAKCGV